MYTMPIDSGDDVVDRDVDCDKIIAPAWYPNTVGANESSGSGFKNPTCHCHRRHHWSLRDLPTYLLLRQWH